LGGFFVKVIRRAGAGSVAVLSGLILIAGLIPMNIPNWARPGDPDSWSLWPSHGALQETSAESNRIQDRADELRLSVEAVDHIAMRLGTGDLTLSEAAALAEPWVRERPGFVTTAEYRYAAASFRISVARYLIAKVQYLLEEDPSRSAVALVRLEREFQTLLQTQP
jgi:hypothetical protein